MAAKHVFLLTSKFQKKSCIVNVTTRNYAIGLRRKKINVYQSETAQDIGSFNQKKTELAFARQPKTSLSATDQSVTEQYVSISGENDTFALRYKVVDHWKPIMQRLRETQRASSNDHCIEMFLEGAKTIETALNRGVEITEIYFDTLKALQKLHLSDNCSSEIYKISTSKMKEVSDHQKPPGVIAIAKRPVVPLRQENRVPMTLIVDRVSAPASMGILLNAAAVTGCHAVITMQGCVDPWYYRVVSQAAGAHFALPIISGVQWEHTANYIPHNTHVCLAQNRSTRRAEDATIINDTKAAESISRGAEFSLPEVSLHDLDLGSKGHVTVVVSGNHGLSPQAKHFLCDRDGEDVFIPSVDDIVASHYEPVIGCLVLENARGQLKAKNLINERNMDIRDQYVAINKEIEEKHAEVEEIAKLKEEKRTKNKLRSVKKEKDQYKDDINNEVDENTRREMHIKDIRQTYEDLLRANDTESQTDGTTKIVSGNAVFDREDIIPDGLAVVETDADVDEEKSWGFDGEDMKMDMKHHPRIQRPKTSS